MNLTYSELSQLKTFEERFNYLKLNGSVGFGTFGGHRVLNQDFYSSKEWRNIRKFIIARDNGCDLGVEGHEIYDGVVIHHINPLSIDDITHSTSLLFDPENLICVSENTHNAIHFGKSDILDQKVVVRTKNDTSPWRK